MNSGWAKLCLRAVRIEDIIDLTFFLPYIASLPLVLQFNQSSIHQDLRVSFNHWQCFGQHFALKVSQEFDSFLHLCAWEDMETAVTDFVSLLVLCLLTLPRTTLSTLHNMTSNNNMSNTVYAFDKDTGIHEVSLSCNWKSSQSTGSTTFNSTLGDVRFHMRKLQGVWLFLIEANWTNATMLNVFKSCTTSTLQGSSITQSELTLKPSINIQPGKLKRGQSWRRTKNSLVELFVC